MALGSLPVHTKRMNKGSFRVLNVKLMTSAGGDTFANDIPIDIDHIRGLTEPQRQMLAHSIVDKLVKHMCDQWRVTLDGQ